jgi:nuclear pore complex protein Nup205
MASGTLDVLHGAVGRYEIASAFTWCSIFSELESWAALGSGHRSAHSVPPPQLPITPKGVLLGMSFLKLLSSVITHSVQARIAIASQYRAVGSLVALIPLGVPLELKGALFETLSAFCIPGAGVQGVEICKTVWVHKERLEVINVRGAGIMSKGSVEVELEEIVS